MRPLFKIDEGPGADEILPEPILRQALRTELARVLKASWRRAALAHKDDAVSMLAREMDLPPVLARKYAQAALASNGDIDDPGAAGQPERSAPLFTASNHHYVTDGKPPFVDGDEPRRYVGYFVNEHGEQAVFACDAETGEAIVRLGDAGWQAVHRVVDGEPQHVLLTEAERTWIRACWLATAPLRAKRD